MVALHPDLSNIRCAVLPQENQNWQAETRSRCLSQQYLYFASLLRGVARLQWCGYAQKIRISTLTLYCMTCYVPAIYDSPNVFALLGWIFRHRIHTMSKGYRKFET